MKFCCVFNGGLIEVGLMTGTMKRECIYNPTIIVIVTEITIENDDGSQLNGDVTGRRCCCDCDIIVVASSTEVPEISKFADRSKV